MSETWRIGDINSERAVEIIDGDMCMVCVANPTYAHRIINDHNAAAQVAALVAAGDRLAHAAIGRCSPPGTTEWQSSCLICAYRWWDSEPPRHSPGCPVPAWLAVVPAHAAPAEEGQSACAIHSWTVDYRTCMACGAPGEATDEPQDEPQCGGQCTDNTGAPYWHPDCPKHGADARPEMWQGRPRLEATTDAHE